MARKQMTVYRVTAGRFARDYATRYHAEQMARALRFHTALRGVPIAVEKIRMPDDSLTRITTA